MSSTFTVEEEKELEKQAEILRYQWPTHEGPHGTFKQAPTTSNRKLARTRMKLERAKKKGPIQKQLEFRKESARYTEQKRQEREKRRRAHGLLVG